VIDLIESEKLEKKKVETRCCLYFFPLLWPSMGEIFQVWWRVLVLMLFFRFSFPGEADKITSLPGLAEQTQFNLYSGYLTTNITTGKDKVVWRADDMFGCDLFLDFFVLFFFLCQVLNFL
jgi:hypothetical protein